MHIFGNKNRHPGALVDSSMLNQSVVKIGSGSSSILNKGFLLGIDFEQSSAVSVFKSMANNFEAVNFGVNLTTIVVTMVTFDYVNCSKVQLSPRTIGNQLFGLTSKVTTLSVDGATYSGILLSYSASKSAATGLNDAPKWIIKIVFLGAPK